MADQLKNVMIGLFVLAAVTIIVFALMFFHPSVGDERRVLRVRFANIDKISVGTRVTFAGKPVGEVAAITELTDAISERIPRDGVVYVYELKLHVDSSVNVFDTDEIAAKTSGLLGERSIVITPLPSYDGVPIRNVNNEIIYASEIGGVEDAIKEFKNISGKVVTALDSLNIILEDMNKHQVVKTASHALVNFDKFSDRLLNSWDKVENILTDGSVVLDQVKRGEGSFGRFIMNDQLYLKLNAVLSKGETVMNDINHYGLLFNMDKGWQRLRARRMNLMYTLSSPQQFRNFFNDEIDQISTSLNRVYSVVESSTSMPCGDSLFENCEFQKVYAELLRRIIDTEEALKMYNQQLSDENCRITEICN